MIKPITRFGIYISIQASIIIFLFSCTSSDHKSFEQKEFYKNGNLKNLIYSKSKDTSYLNFEEYYKSGHLKSKGEIDSTGLREGEWKYYNEDQTVKAKGSYSKGSKIGLWAYDNKTAIEWDIYESSEDSFRINIPSEWLKKTYKESKLIGFYEGDIDTNFVKNFNIIVVNDSRTLLEISNESLNEAKIYYDDIIILEREQININGSESIITKIEATNKNLKIYGWQVLVGNTEHKINLNFFSLKESEQIFNEIIYSVFML